MDIDTLRQQVRAFADYLETLAEPADILDPQDAYGTLEQVETILDSLDTLSVIDKLTQQNNSVGGMEYTAKVGDTLDKICAKFNVTPDAIDAPNIPVAPGDVVVIQGINVTDPTIPISDLMTQDRALGTDIGNDTSDNPADVVVVSGMNCMEQGISNLLMTRRGAHPAFIYWGLDRGLAGGTDLDTVQITMSITNALSLDTRISKILSADIVTVEDEAKLQLKLALANGQTLPLVIS